MLCGISGSAVENFIRKELFFLMAVFGIAKLRIKNERQNFFELILINKKLMPSKALKPTIKISILTLEITEKILICLVQILLIKFIRNKNFFFSLYFRYSLPCPGKIFLYTSCENRFETNHNSI